MSFDFSIDIDTSEMFKKLGEVETYREEVETAAVKTIDFISAETRKAMQKTLVMVRASWAITQGVLQAMGVSVSAQFRMIMSAVLGSVSMLMPVLTAQTMTPATMFQGFMGLMELTAAIAAMGVAESEFKQNEAAYFSAMRILNGVQALFGGMYFL